MDISALSSLAASTASSDVISIAMLSKAMDTFEDSGTDMVRMMEASVTPHLGQNIDVCV